jgi:PncC family amidohydrolase
MVSAALTSVPGSSLYFRGGIVAYANGVKAGLLGVPAEMLARRGAVSEAVARRMAKGVRTRLTADVSVAVTGIAGPGGGTAAKPVGTVFVAVADDRGSEARRFRFRGTRAAVRSRSCAAALALLAARVEQRHAAPRRRHA